MEASSARAVPIVLPDSQNRNKFLFKEDDLESILLQEDIKDRNAIVISITGEFRKGKSFLLNFLLRYLESMSTSGQKTDDWLGDENSPLEGFSWRCGSEPDTTGILMWSKVFKIDLPNDEKAAVILIDTQGSFDHKSTVRECATVFALGSMLSSILIYNIFHNLQEDHLQHLELFTEYGRLLLRDTGHKPFQKLQFLIRDWSCPYEKSYGPEGGRALVENRLKITDEHAPEQKSLRNHIKSCFTDIECFLMPHPGSKVATNPNFDGRLSDIEDDFKTLLKQFVPLLFSNPVQKKIGGQKVKVKELLFHFKWYMEFNGDDLPEPTSMLLATAEANFLSAVATGREYFQRYMQKAFETNEPYLTNEELEEECKKNRTEAINQFDKKPKLGPDELVEKHRTNLIQGIESDFSRYRTFNKGKAEASNQLGLAAGKETYSRNMALVCSVEPYLSLDEFKAQHEKHRQAALRVQFGSRCTRGRDVLADVFRVKLEEDIISECNRLYTLNQTKAEANNQAAIVASKEIYQKDMNEVVQNSNEPCFSPEKLDQIHLKCKTKALEHFNSRCIPGDEFSDTNRNSLEKDIDKDYEHFKTFSKNRMNSFILTAITAAREAYLHEMNAVCESARPYLSNDELEREHVRWRAEVIQKFTANREFSESDKNKLRESIDTDYNKRFKNLNKSKADVYLQLAASSAKEAYNRQMTELFDGPQMYCSADEFELEHQKRKTAVLEQFMKQCEGCEDDFFSKTYKIKLEEEIEKDREWFQTHNESKKNVARAFSIGKVAKKMDIIRDIFSGATTGAVVIGTAAAGPAGALFGAVWGAIMGRRISAMARGE